MNKETRGGAREGAGRPRGTKKENNRKPLTVSLSVAAHEKLDRLVANKSRFVDELILNFDEVGYEQGRTGANGV